MTTSSVALVDSTLATHPRFADSRSILERNIARFRLGLKMLAARAEVVGPYDTVIALDDDRIRPLHLDPVLRNAFEDDMARLENGLDTVGGFDHYLNLIPVADGDRAGPCERLSRPRRRPWPDHGCAWVWTTMRADDPASTALLTRLDELGRGTLSATSAGLVAADEEMFTALKRGADLLAELLPGSGAGVLPHVSLVGFARDEGDDEQLYSLSGGDPLPSAVIMAPNQLADPWTTAEALLHEGLHLKLFDVVRSGALTTDPEIQVSIPWRTRSWTLIRVLLALHVYVHLLLFRTAAGRADPGLYARYGRPPQGDDMDAPSPGSPAAANGTHRTQLARARFLAEHAIAHTQRLTPDGRRFVTWLLDAIEPIVSVSSERSAAPADADPSHGQPETGTVGGYRRVEPVVTCPLPDQGLLLVMPVDEPKIRWLNANAWTVYALCDGQPGELLESKYRRLHGGDHKQAAARLRTGLRALSAAGLIIPPA